MYVKLTRVDNRKLIWINFSKVKAWEAATNITGSIVHFGDYYIEVVENTSDILFLVTRIPVEHWPSQTTEPQQT